MPSNCEQCEPETMTTHPATTRAVIGFARSVNSVGSISSPVCVRVHAGACVDTQATTGTPSPTPLCMCAAAYKRRLNALSCVGVFNLSTLIPNRGELITAGLAAGWVSLSSASHPSQGGAVASTPQKMGRKGRGVEAPPPIGTPPEPARTECSSLPSTPVAGQNISPCLTPCGPQLVRSGRGLDHGA